MWVVFYCIISPIKTKLMSNKLVLRDFKDLKKEEVQLICDYLCLPSTCAKHDNQRRKELYDLNIVKKTKKNQENGKYLSGPLGEAIVRLYFDKLGILYIPHPPEVTYYDEVEGKVTIRPDGGLLNGLNIWVESKMRAYHSAGTASSKIHGVPEKYCEIGKLMLFLLADDEHKFNRRWYKLRRNEVKPKNKCEEYHILGDLEVLHSIVLGTEIANILQN